MCSAHGENLASGPYLKRRVVKRHIHNVQEQVLESHIVCLGRRASAANRLRAASGPEPAWLAIGLTDCLGRNLL